MTTLATTKERPILFSGPMVKAILYGRKTMTRRPIPDSCFPVLKAERHHILGCDGQSWTYKYRVGLDKQTNEWKYKIGTWPITKYSPFGQVGDHLYVRENFALVRALYHSHESIRPDDYEAWVGPLPQSHPVGWGLAFGADDTSYESARDRGFPWRPSIHMPRWASRVTLEITGVKVERLHAISEEDATTEGVTASANYSAVQHFARLWGEINGPGSWDANPWVWALSFRRIES